MRNNSLLRNLLLAFTLTVGLGAAWAVLVGWGAAITEMFLRTGQTYESLYVLDDGTPVIESYESGRVSYVRSRRTLDGRQLDLDDQTTGRLSAAFLDATWTGAAPLHQSFWSNRILAFNDGQTPPVFWYFIHDGTASPRGFFVGYESRSKRQVGYIGHGGFRTGPPRQDELFEYRALAAMNGPVRQSEPWYYGASGKVYVLDSDEVHEVNLLDGSIRRVFASEDLVSLAFVSSASNLQSTAAILQGEAPLARLAVRAERAIYVIPIAETDAPPPEPDVFELPDGVQGEMLNFYLTGGGTALLNWTPPGVDYGRLNHLVFYNPQGEVARREEVSLNRGQYPVRPRTQSLVLAGVFPAPIASGAASLVFLPITLLERKQEETYPQALAATLAETWPAVLLTLLVGGLAAWSAYRRQQRYAQGHAAAWAVFVFVFGLPGWLAHRFHRRWPTMEPCPACGHISPRDRETCAVCCDQLPEPAPLGIEVFA